MTNEQILKKVIEKAIKNGYEGEIKNLSYEEYDCQVKLGKRKEFKLYYTYIFSHDFAKAFWRNDITWFWQYCLRQMVSLPDNKRIKYLEKFL